MAGGPRGALSSLGAAALFCAIAPSAVAQSAEATRLRAQGARDFERYVVGGRFNSASPLLAKACANYRASLDKEDDVETRIDLANCYNAMRRRELAFVEISRALGAAEARAQGAPPGADADRLVAEARRQQERISRKSAHWRVEVGAPGSSDLTISYDGQSVSHERWGQDLVMDDGEHVVAVQTPGMPDWAAMIVGKAGAPTLVVVPPLHQNPSSHELAKFCGELEAAAAAQSDPQALLNLANCHSAMGKYQRASRELVEVQRRAHEAGDPRLTEEADRERGYIAQTAPHLFVDVRAAARPGLTVFYDGRPLPHESLGQPLLADIGEHEVSAQAPGASRWATRARGGVPAVHIVVPKLAPATPRVSAPARRAAPPTPA
jgi:tetratricopeptide (TPR) repeat protein